MPDNALAALIDDFTAERKVLETVIRGAAPEVWDRSSPAEGWTFRDCVAHLADHDDNATAIVTSTERVRRLPSSGVERDGVLAAGQLWAREQPASEIADWYVAAGVRLVDAMRKAEPDTRLTWAGRPMSARSFLTARLMEHWSHGLDIHDAAGLTPVDTDRLRHVAHLGYMTRDFAFRNRGLPVPETALYVELTAPSGETWTWGPADAPDQIRGTAGDFCRVVCQRIHWSDTSLVATGPTAYEFLAIAQAFAGPSGSGRPPRMTQTV